MGRILIWGELHGGPGFGDVSCLRIRKLQLIWPVFFFQPPGLDPTQGLGRKQTTICFEEWRLSGNMAGSLLAQLLLGSPYQRSLGQNSLLGMGFIFNGLIVCFPIQWDLFLIESAGWVTYGETQDAGVDIG